MMPFTIFLTNIQRKLPTRLEYKGVDTNNNIGLKNSWKDIKYSYRIRHHIHTNATV